MEKKIEWTTKTGKKATVTVGLQTSKTVNLNGDVVTVQTCELYVSAEVDGLGVVGSGEPVKVKHPVAVATIGKLALTAENLAAVEHAIDTVKNAPEWQAKESIDSAARESARRYDESTARIRRAMGAGWSE